jgi:hypothetical protein
MEPANLTPAEVVSQLGQHIIGQEGAKRAIAVALRNRWRRMRLTQEQQDEIIPKNILMVRGLVVVGRPRAWQSSRSSSARLTSPSRPPPVPFPVQVGKGL